MRGDTFADMDKLTGLHPDPGKLTGTLPQPVTCITVYKDRVFLASGQRVYELVDGVWHRMVFAE